MKNNLARLISEAPNVAILKIIGERVTRHLQSDRITRAEFDELDELALRQHRKLESFWVLFLTVFIFYLKFYHVSFPRHFRPCGFPF